MSCGWGHKRMSLDVISRAVLKKWTRGVSCGSSRLTNCSNFLASALKKPCGADAIPTIYVREKQGRVAIEMLKIHTQKLGNVAILCLQGEVVIGDTDGLSEAVRSQSNASMVVLDFARVQIIDAKGLGLLLELRDFMRSRGIEFRLVNMNRLIQQVLNITRLNTVLEVSNELKVRAPARDQSTTILPASCFQEV